MNNDYDIVNFTRGVMDKIRTLVDVSTNEPSGVWFQQDNELYFETGFWRAKLIPEGVGYRVFISTSIKNRDKWDEKEWFPNLVMSKVIAEAYLVGRST